MNLKMCLTTLLLLFTYSVTCCLAHHKTEELRNEQFTSLGQQIHEGNITQPNGSLVLKVMTYNVLSQTVLEANNYLYKDHNVASLQWDNRWPLIYKKIRDEDPHILCLQEVDSKYISSHFEKLVKDLGYNLVYKQSPGSYKDGVAVLYKSNTFVAEAISGVELNRGEEPLTADKVGVVARLKARDSGATVVVATTHLVFNPRRSDTRLAQAQVMLAEIDKLAYNNASEKYYPVILTGDFNLQPYTGVYRFLTEGRLKYEGLSSHTLEPSGDNTLSRVLPCSLGVTDESQYVDVVEARARKEEVITTRAYQNVSNNNTHRSTDNCTSDSRFGSGTISHKFNFKSAYPHRQGNKLEASTNHNNHWITVDYIFYSSVSASSIPQLGPLELLSWERLPTQDELETIVKHLPNADHGSDHLPLTATFLLRLNCESDLATDYSFLTTQI